VESCCRVRAPPSSCRMRPAHGAMPSVADSTPVQSPGLVRAALALAGIAAFALCTALALAAPAPRLVRADGRRLREAVATPSAGTANKVRVELYGEAGCPFTRGFVLGPVAEMLTSAADLVDFHLHAFGNSYYVTKECGGSAEGMPFNEYNRGYDSSIRQCFDKLCGSEVTEPPEDCFTGPAVFQHGVLEGLATTAWACAVKLTGGKPRDYMPFLECTSKHYLSIDSEDAFRSVVETCAGDKSQSLLSCAVGPQGKAFLKQQARETPPHPGVPYTLIDGVELNETECVTCGVGLMSEVCKAHRRRGNEDAPVCKSILR